MDPLRRITRAQKFALARELRARATPAERFAWSLLRNRGVLGLKFRRQHVLHGFIVDFCCLEAGIVIELDGHVHNTEPQRGYDAARGAVLKGAGFQSVPLSGTERGSGGEDPERRGGHGVRTRNGEGARGTLEGHGA
ncbi:MAG: DUF559 domain-containing protein [Chloroflexi bacterium]|nr:MAG: DUF559 domain-containing protein [Chloroflexota bacterium]